MSVGDPRVGLIGLGATGASALRLLLDASVGSVEAVEPVDRRAAAVLAALDDGERARVRIVDRITPDVGVVVVASPCGGHLRAATTALGRRQSVVSLSDDPDEVASLLALDLEAREAGLTLVAGAGLSPGVSCLLADLGAAELDEVVEVAVVKTGTGGPACARQHHHALKHQGVEWLDGTWVSRVGGTGRELAWFPGDLGARDAYRAALAEPVLLQRRFPDAGRLSARMTATRRDRLTSRFPMLRPPHSDGGPGGIRVEVRGRRDGAYRTIVHGVMAIPSQAAGTLAATVALELERLEAPRLGAVGVGELGMTRRLLASCRAAGLQIARFEGSISSARRGTG